MKRALSLIAVLFMAVPALAGQQSTSTLATAVVNAGLSITVAVYENSVTGPTGPNLGSIPFGALAQYQSAPGVVPAWGPVLRSQKAYCAMVTANSSSVPYTIKQTAQSLTYLTNKIPDGAFVVVPVYSSVDNGGLTNTGTLGAKGTAVAVDKTIYTSGGSHGARTIQAIYAITDDPNSGATAAVPIDQPAGTYQGTVTFTVNT